jgi:nucleoid-associated protein EbfC
MFKGLGNMASMMKQAQEMQGKIKEMQESLGSLKVEGSAGGGMVVVEASGHQKILSIRIEEELIGTDDKEMLEDLITAATNQALDKAKELAEEEMAKLTGGMDLPGLGDAMSQLGLG